jgi:hypothetical protein
MPTMTGHDVEQLTNITNSWRRRYLVEVLSLLYSGARTRLLALFFA